MANQTNTVERVNPGQNDTAPGRSNLSEIMPGFNKNEASEMSNMGSALYANPSLTKVVAEQNRRNLRRDGCRKTDFILRERQNVDLAATGATHRILKVEFFDLVKEPIPGTNPVEYQTITVPGKHLGGPLNMQVATLGASPSVYWERVGETHTIRYTYTPFSSSKGRNYFTYNHWLGYSTGGAIQRVVGEMVSYGSPSDSWKTVHTHVVPTGATAAYLTADLYQTKVTYTEPAPGNPCPPDPPEVCEVGSIGGDPIRFCPGSFGANIASMYDDVAHPSSDRYGKTFNDQMANNAARKDYTTDPSIRAGVITGVNAPASAKAQELIGQCSRDAVSRVELNQGGSYGIPNMQMCSETLVNPYPQGCDGLRRSFGLSYMGEHNYLTVKAFNKTKVPIIDPATNKQIKDADGNPLFTYKKEPTNVQGQIDTSFPIMGAAICPGQGRCSTEIPDDPLGTSEGKYLEYLHYPMGGDPKASAFDGVYAQAGATSNFTNYGSPLAQWLPTGTASGDGTLHEIRMMAKAYSVTINTFAGCERYMEYIADGFCKGGKLTCKETSATRSVGGVTFGPGLANKGIVDLLKTWGTDASTVMPSEYDNGVGSEPTPNGPPIKLLDDPMCWLADAEPFTSCSTMNNEKGTLRTFLRDGQQWATDCNLAADDKGVPLENSPSCKRVPENDGCDTRFKGPFTGQCYNPTLAYDCGETKPSTIPVIVEELGDACSGAMRCLGTQCHRPNLAGTHGGDFARAVGAMEAVNAMVEDMVCLETGEKPTSVTQACTPYIFGGKAMYCKIPIGNEIGLTPNCCKEAQKGAKSAPSWMEYLSALQTLGKIGQRMGVMQAMQGSEVYGQISRFFGDVKQPVVDAYSSASQFVTDKFITPFRAGFDNLVGGNAAPEAVGSVGKAGGISELIHGFEQQIMAGIQDILTKIGGEELSGMVIQTGANGLEFTAGMQNLMFAFQIYSIARLIGHIIFACKKEEYEWGMQDRWRLCTFADSCCNKKVPLLGCVEKRQLYCCYKSIAIRVISSELIKKNLTGSRPRGFRSANDGSSLGGCNINCGGFTAFELAAVDWSRVDLTEWTDALIESGQLNPADPRTNYGISQNRIKETMTVGRDADPQGNFTTKVPAVKSAELLGQNIPNVTNNTEVLKEAPEHCYKDSRLMPFTYPGCKSTP
ncbi:conjugal transfer protein TraN [Acidovorax sp. LjRoot129]|uniref:conjugal transfer protein TraN n=1 Tax=unclassified Acidovorax TaxID=2684926 RepID=UPI003ED13D6E